MRFFDKFLQIFDRRQRITLGAIDQPSDLMAHLYAVRARTFERITGKSLQQFGTLQTVTRDPDVSLSKDLSPARRLLRR
jgi:hypothetical protein